MTPATIRKRFFSVLENAEQNIHLFVNVPGSDMTRHRRCPLLDTIKATLCLTMNRTNTELFDFFMSCVQRSWTTLAGVSPVTVIASEPCS